MGVFDLDHDALLTEADHKLMDNFFGVLQAPDWVQSSQDADGCCISWKQDPNNPIILVKGVVPIKASIKAVCDFMIDDNDAKRAQHMMQTLDKMCKGLEIVKVIDAKHAIKYATFTMPPPIWPRDFVWEELHTRRPDGGYVSIGASIDYPDRPPVSGKWINEVRAEITVSGYWIEPGPDGPDSCIGHYLMQCDPKGMIPAAVVNMCCMDQGLNVKRLKETVEKGPK